MIGMRTLEEREEKKREELSNYGGDKVENGQWGRKQTMEKDLHQRPPVVSVSSLLCIINKRRGNTRK